MSRINAPHADWLSNKFAKIEADIKALAGQQNQSVVDPNLTLRLYSGRQPTGEYNTTTYDDGGNPRATFGQLPDGNHGVAIYSELNDGSYVELNAPLVGTEPGPFTTTSATPVTIGGSPTREVTVGASGKCLVAISAILETSAAGVEAMMYLVVDSILNPLQVDASAASSALQLTASNIGVVVGLAQGSHTLSLQYAAPIGGTATFEEPSITAIPY